MTPAEVTRRFTYVAPSGEAKTKHSSVRRWTKEFATLLAFNLPEGREQSLAFTALEEASFWAHAAIARDPSLHDPEASA